MRLNSQHDALLFRLNHTREGDRWIEKPKEKQIQFVPYDFRHTFTTRMAQQGTDLATLAEILGHSPRSGLRIVSRSVHPTEEHQREAMLRYDATLLAAGNAAAKGRASFGPVVM